MIQQNSCFSALCNDPSPPANGGVNVIDDSVGGTAMFSCDSGFELDGENTATCTAAVDGNSATFTPIPTCIRESLTYYIIIIIYHEAFEALASLLFLTV